MDMADALAAATREAYARVVALDRCGHTVSLAEREAAIAAWEAAKAAEAAYWEGV